MSQYHYRTALFLVLSIFACGALGWYEFDDGPCNRRSFTHIVVGSGTGAVVAARLSEDPDNIVALVEAGKPTQRSVGGRDYVTSSFYYDANNNYQIGEPFTREDVPIFARTVRPPRVPFYAINANEPQYLFDSQSSVALGGSFTHNNMVWIRPDPSHINSWNVTGWNYTQVLPFYKRSENATGSTGEINPSLHGFNGPIKISDPQAIPPIGAAYVNACIANYRRNDDYNGPSKEGCGFASYNIRRGVRDSPINAYIAPVLRRRNLFIIDSAMVTKVLFRTFRTGRLPEAYGVRYVKNGRTYDINATSEVIISAGAFKTPQILLLSGVGPAAELRALNITVIANNPNVGRNLRFHQRVDGRFRINTCNNTYPALYGTASESLKYGLNGTGAYAGVGIWGWNFVKTNTSLPGPDMYISVSDGDVDSTIINVGITSTLPRMRSGVVSLNSANPNDPPKVTTNVFEFRSDLEKLAKGIEIMRKTFNTAPLKSFVLEELIPGPQYNTTDKLVDFIRLKGSYSAHIVGSAKFGNDDDTTAVCDCHLRVRGVKGLRVADTSSLPNIDGHSQASAVMVGERAAYLIRNGDPNW